MLSWFRLRPFSADAVMLSSYPSSNSLWIMCTVDGQAVLRRLIQRCDSPQWARQLLRHECLRNVVIISGHGQLNGPMSSESCSVRGHHGKRWIFDVQLHCLFYYTIMQCSLISKPYSKVSASFYCMVFAIIFIAAIVGQRAEKLLLLSQRYLPVYPVVIY